MVRINAFTMRYKCQSVHAGCAQPCLGRPPHRRSLTVAAAQNECVLALACNHTLYTCCHSFGEAIQRLARQVQGSLPVVGLLSRIMTPTGGVGNDELVCTIQHTSIHTHHLALSQSYPDFCRSLYEQGIEPLNIAVSDLEKAYGKVCHQLLFTLLPCTPMHRQHVVCVTCSTACGHAGTSELYSPRLSWRVSAAFASRTPALIDICAGEKVTHHQHR